MLDWSVDIVEVVKQIVDDFADSAIVVVVVVEIILFVERWPFFALLGVEVVAVALQALVERFLNLVERFVEGLLFVEWVYLSEWANFVEEEAQLG